MKATNILTITFLPKKWFALAAICLLLTACSKDKNDSLPPETQTGAGTFGCKIDGKVWVPKGSDGYSGQNIKANYIYYYPPGADGYSMVISAHDYNGDPSSFFVIGSDSIKWKLGLRVPLFNAAVGRGGAR